MVALPSCCKTPFEHLSQQELIRKAGMRSVRQACGKTFEEVEDFLKSESFPVVSKNLQNIKNQQLPWHISLENITIEEL